MPKKIISPTERTRAIWRGMKKRCLDSRDKRWKDYGGRGIVVDPKWLDFSKFLKDMGAAPAGQSIERKNNDRGYKKSNCKWATRLEQQNNMRTNRRIVFGGQAKNLSQWARDLGVNGATLSRRISLMPIEEAMQPGPIERKFRNYQKYKCRWCSFERVRIKDDRFCSKCHLNEEGENWRILRERARGVRPKHCMKLTAEEIERFSNIEKRCTSCGETKLVFDGFGLRRPFVAARSKYYLMPRVYCKICDGKKTYQRQLKRKAA